MKRFKKLATRTAKWGGIGLGALGAVLAVAIAVLERRTYDAPLPAITASADPAVIARGKYLVYGAAHCVDCHGDPARRADAAAGREIPLSGGNELHLPVGTFRPANLTSDGETGLGRASDGLLARVLRQNVRRDGRVLLPLMPSFADLSDEDLTAVISYLRTQAPVSHRVETRAPNVLGHAVLAFVIRPVGPTGPVPARVAPAPTAEYGRYLVHNVANCAGCHTERDLRTGKFVGRPLAGGMNIPSESDPARHFVTPNLTFDPATGRITNWTEEIFQARFHMGRGAEGSPMPWASFGRMSDDDLGAVYRYLRSLPPVAHDTGPSVIGPTAQPLADATPSPSR